MAQFPLILQQSMTSMDELQATMEEVRPLLWFTAGLFVFTLLLTTILIFRKQHQKKKKKHASKAANQTPDIQEKQVIEKKPEPEIKPEEKPTVQEEIREEKPQTIIQTPEVATPSPEKVEKKTFEKNTTISTPTSKEEVTSLVDQALKETKSREENLEAIKKRIQELRAGKKDDTKTEPIAPPAPPVAEDKDPMTISFDPMTDTQDIKEIVIEEAEVIILETTTIFEPMTSPSEIMDNEEFIPAEVVEEASSNAQAEDENNSTNDSPESTPPASMLPQQIKTFADWLRDFK